MSGWLSQIRAVVQALTSGAPVPTNGDAKFKHLELISAVITRMANNSFLFKGWSITIATSLAAFAAVERKRGLLLIAVITGVIFWALDGYYLWLERRFRDLYNVVAKKDNGSIDFSMAIDRRRAFRRWLRTCLRIHLIFFYGGMMLAEVIAIVLLTKMKVKL